MSSVTLVNSLTGLLILTSLLVIEIKRPRWSALMYSLQSIVLVSIFAILAYVTGTNQLYLWAASAFLTKVVLVPWILYTALKRVGDPEKPRNVMGTTFSFLLAAVAVTVSFIVVNQIALKAAEPFKPALAISMAHFFFGELCILTQRNLFKQILGFCLMENGSHLTLALLAFNAPELVEIGIATDAVFGVIIMVVLGQQIYKNLGTLDTADLTTLKG
ncbi:MAG TPA: hydrogenase 4 membrane subunit [Anaerolineales bacterium]|nr:hydrogenase 4 membrane subunit [Anaerolineales bacterium]